MFSTMQNNSLHLLENNFLSYKMNRSSKNTCILILHVLYLHINFKTKKQ